MLSIDIIPAEALSKVSSSINGLTSSVVFPIFSSSCSIFVLDGIIILDIILLKI